MKIQTQTFRGFGKKKELFAQTAVECRFGGEVETILTAHAHAALTGADAGNGEVRYYGKAHFSIVYEDAEKHVCRAEKGVEFAAVCKDESVYPAESAKAAVTVENVSVRREGASVFLTALLGTDIALYGEESFDYLSGGDLILKREPVKVLSAHLCGGASEAEDEFETELLGDILQHSETVCVTDVVCETGLVKAEGEINLGVLALKQDGSLTSFERLIPFRVEIPCDSAAFGCGAEVKVGVADASLHAEEENGKCNIYARFTLMADGCVYEETALDGAIDAFSTECETELSYFDGSFDGMGESKRVTERVSGKAILSGSIDFSDSLEAVTLQRSEAELVKTDAGLKAEGVAGATLLVRSSEGEYRAVEIALPFSVAVEARDAEASVMVCGMSARQKQEGEIDAEATVKILLKEKTKYEVRLVGGVKEGEKLKESDSAISVYIPKAGDGLWELAKRLKKSPEDVEKSNPDIEFPVKEGQRVIIYRKKAM